MASIPNKVRGRLTTAIKQFQPIVQSAKSRDVNESDTVIIVTDMLADLFGYDKYSEITSESVIKGTYVDLAIKLDGKPIILIEVKAVGLELKDSHIKQAVDYAANQGIDWVILTNGVLWQVYQVSFGKPIGQELVIEINFLDLNPKDSSSLECLYLITKEGVGRSVLGDFQAQRQALSRFFIGAMVLSDTVLAVIRRELRRMSPDVKIESEEIKTVLLQEVLKREVVEGEKADDARRKIARAARVVQKRSAKASVQSEGDELTAAPETATSEMGEPADQLTKPAATEPPEAATEPPPVAPV